MQSKRVGEMTVGDWRTKRVKIGKWSSGVLTPYDYDLFKKQNNMRK